MTFPAVCLSVLLGFGVMAYVNSDVYQPPASRAQQLSCEQYTKLPNGQWKYTYLCSH